MRMMHKSVMILPLLLVGWLPSWAMALDLGPVESLQFETLPGQFTLRGPFRQPRQCVESKVIMA